MNERVNGFLFVLNTKQSFRISVDLEIAPRGQFAPMLFQNLKRYFTIEVATIWLHNACFFEITLPEFLKRM